MENTLTGKQAFDAMYRFLEFYYNATKSDDLSILVSELSLLTDGKPVRRSAGEYWNETVEAIFKENHALLHQAGNIKEDTLSYFQAYQAVGKFLDGYYDHLPDVATLISRMKLLPNGGVSDSTVWTNWLKAIDLMLNEKDPTYGYLKMKTTITKQQAFDYMVKFLKSYYCETASADLKSLLTGLLRVGEKKTADPRAWPLWMETVEVTKEETPHFKLMLHIDENSLAYVQAYKAIVKFLEKYYKGAPPSDVQVLLNRMRMSPNGKVPDRTVWERWEDISEWKVVA
jgi:hypothetical protein